MASGGPQPGGGAAPGRLRPGARLALALQRQARASRTRHHPTGTIIRSQVEAYQTLQSDSQVPRTRYRADIVYQDRVGGRQYSSDHVSLGTRVSSASPAWVKTLLARYPVGRTLTVYYNPNKPGESVLERRVRGALVLGWVAAGLLLLAAMASGLL